VRFPEPAASVLEELDVQVRELLGPNLQAMYVYGSLTFECYNPARSDVDVLVVTRRRMAPETRRAVASFLHRLAETAHVEISFLSRADLEPWCYPTPFDYHFSGEDEMEDGAGAYFATEIANARTRGIALFGPPPQVVLPPVPDEDFLDAIERDLDWVRERVHERPGYAVLNCCRVLAFRQERTVMSKAQGAQWAARAVPERFRPLVAEAAAWYASPEDRPVDRRGAAEFLDWVQGGAGA
jgi:streptomycin 3"-adenylyltransferase